MSATQLVLASPATLTELVSRLPADARAQVAWTPKRIADMANALLTAPMLTDGAIEAAGDAYLEAALALSPVVLGLASQGADLKSLMEHGLAADLKLVNTLAPVAAKAAVRATATILVVAHLGLHTLGKIDITELQRAMESLEGEFAKQHFSMLRAAALVTAVFEGVRKGSPIPGRVEALARRADLAAQAFAAGLAAEDEALRLPWYVESAPGAASVAAFASWNPDNGAWAATFDGPSNAGRARGVGAGEGRRRQRATAPEVVLVIVVLDSGVLGKLCAPRLDRELDVWMIGLQTRGRRVVVPEVCDYELRREMIRNRSSTLATLDDLETTLDYLPITTAAMRRAATLWAQLRAATASEDT